MTTRKYYPEVDAKGRIIPEVAVADAPRLRQIARVLETSRAIRDAVAAGDLDPVALDLLSEVGLLPGAASTNAGFESSPLGYLRGGPSRLSEELGIRSGNLGPSEMAGNRNYGPGPWTQFGAEAAPGSSDPWAARGGLPSRLDLVSVDSFRPSDDNNAPPMWKQLEGYYGVPSPNDLGPRPSPETTNPPERPTPNPGDNPPFVPAGPIPKSDLGPDGASPGAAAFARWLGGRFNSPGNTWKPTPSQGPDRRRLAPDQETGRAPVQQFHLHRGALVGVERRITSGPTQANTGRSDEPDDERGGWR